MAQRQADRRTKRTTPVSPRTSIGTGGGAIEALERRQLYSGLGINANQVDGTNYGAIVTMLRASGTTDVRLWYGFDTYETRTVANIAKYAEKFHHDGFSVTLAVVPHNGRHGTYDETHDFFTFLSQQTDLVNAVDYWELGNEPGSQNYWRGTLTEFATDYVIPAAKVLHSVGEKVISGAPAYDPGEVQTLVNAGILKYVDYVGYHAYAHSVSQLKSRLNTLHDILGDFPMAATEWNMRGHENDSDKTDWAADVAAMAPLIAQNFALSDYFAATVQDSMAGPAGVLTLSGKPNQPFYRTWFGIQAALHGGSTGGDSGGDSTGGDGSSDGSGDSSGSGTGSSSGGSTSSGGDSSSDGDTDSSGSTTGSTSSGGSKTNSGGTKGGSKGGSKSSDGDTDSSDGSGSKSSDGGTTTSKPTSGRAGGDNTVTGADTGDTTPTPPVVLPVISSLSLINATRDRIVPSYAVLSGAPVIDLSTTGTAYLSLLASGDKRTGSVQFTFGGNTVTETDGAYTLFGDKNGDLVGANFVAGRTYVITAQAFTGANATGTAGDVQTLVVTVIDSSAGITQATDGGYAAAVALAEKRRRRGTTAPTTGTTLPGL